MSPSTSSSAGRLIAQFDGWLVHSSTLSSSCPAKSPSERGDQNGRWSQLWEDGESHLWDRGTPSLPLIHFLESTPKVINKRKDSSRRLRALVPVCAYYARIAYQSK